MPAVPSCLRGWPDGGTHIGEDAGRFSHSTGVTTQGENRVARGPAAVPLPVWIGKAY